MNEFGNFDNNSIFHNAKYFRGIRNIHLARKPQEKANLISPLILKMRGGRHPTPGRNSRASASGDPNDGNVSHRRANNEERAMSVSGKGYQGRMNFAPTHFAVTEEQWAIEGETLMMHTSEISQEYGYYSQVGIFPSPRRV